MMSSIEVNCEKIIVFSSLSLSSMFFRISKIFFVFAECSGRLLPGASDLRLDFAAMAAQSSQ